MAEAREEGNEASQHNDRDCRCLVVAQPTAGHPAYKPRINKSILLCSVKVIVEAPLGKGVTKNTLTNDKLGRILSGSHSHDFSDQIAGKDIWHTCNEEANIAGSLIMRIY